jgi:hypothetical protein
VEVIQKMLKGRYRKLNLLIVLGFLSALLVIPAAKGTGGDSIATAPTFKPGIYPNEVRASSYVWYNVSGKIGANLTVAITYETGKASALRLYAPNGTELGDSNTGSGVEVVSTICASDQLHTIRVAQPAPDGMGEYPFALTICLDGNCGDGGIPGFDWLAAFWGIATLVALVVFYKKRQDLSI